MVGEIGGSEEKAAEFIGAEMTKPVVAYIAGFTAPPGKTMGHAGAIISGSAGTAQAKKEALEAQGVRVGTNPTEVARLAAEVAGAGPARGARAPRGAPGRPRSSTGSGCWRRCSRDRRRGSIPRRWRSLPRSRAPCSRRGSSRGRTAPRGC